MLLAAVFLEVWMVKQLLNMDTLEDIIKQVITDIREKKKKKPDTNFILREAESKHGLSYTCAKSVLDQMIKDKKLIVNEEDSHFINSKANSINEPANITNDSEKISPHTPPSTKASVLGYEEVNEPASQEGGSFSSSYPDTLIAQFISLGKMADSLAELNRLLQEERSRNSILMEENYSLKLKLGSMAVNNTEKEPGQNNTCTRIANDSSTNNNSNNSNDSNNRNKSTLSSKENNQKKINEKESKKVGAMEQTSESQNNQPIESNSESQTMNSNKARNNSKKQKRKANNNNQKPTNTTMNDENIETPNEASDTQQTNELRKPWEWKKDTVLIVGDSMISNINENTLSRRYQTKVRSFQGSTIKDLHDYIKPLLKKKPDKIVLVIGTNDMVNEKLPDILKSLKSLIDQILEALPDCDVVVSEVIVRSDNASLNGKITNFNKALKTMNVDILRQQNITKNHLGKRGLHLNFSGNLQLARNLIEKIRLF